MQQILVWNQHKFHLLINYKIKNKSEFLVDEPIKYYYNLAKVQKHAGFDFKLPSSMETSEWIGDYNAYNLVKLSDTSNAVVMSYNYKQEKDDMCRGRYGMKLLIFKDDPFQSIEKIEKLNSSDVISENHEYNFKENEKNYGKINGKEVTLEEKTPHSDGPASEIVTKYFIWQDDSVYYALKYDNASLYAQDGQNFQVVIHSICIDENEVNKIVNSFKDIDLITDINYKNIDSQHVINCIYDNDDLIESENILGFKAKIPNTFSNKNVKIQKSLIENADYSNEDKYRLDLYYNNEIEQIIYTQSICDCYNSYSDAENKVDEPTTNNNNIEKVDVNGIKVYKYKIYNSADNYYVYYLWKDNDVYNKLEIRYASSYEDDIAKEFINYKF